MGRLVYEVGVYERGKWSCREAGKETREYILWRNMLRRCYSSTCHVEFPTYSDCITSENFKNFQYFAEWCNKQVGFAGKNFQLDKDLICKGNKVYSEDFCVFIPPEVNMFLTNRRKSRGDCPLGVSYDKIHEKFLAETRFRRKSIHIGRYKTPEEAFYAYKCKKVALAKLLASEYAQFIDERAFAALFNFNPEITD